MSEETRVYGASDDLIEFDGGIHGEVSCYGTDDQDQGVMIVFSDNTILEAKYGKGGKGIWEVKLHERGDLFQKIHLCTDENAEVHSDIAYFSPGLKWAYAAKEGWERVS